MCGIFGWAGKNPKKFQKSKFDILGIMNVSRGKHSCGVSVDGDIRIGVDDNKIYADFIHKVGYDNPKRFPHVIGHTRHATFGSHNVHNAHPFGFGVLEASNDFEFVGVHNGSLEEHEELAKSRNIATQLEIRHSKNSYSFRRKIDSEVLLECLYKDGNFSVLSEYTGAAALIFVNNNEPNVIYCYHGKSKEDNWKNSKEKEERPLHYYKETKNSLYISSIPESLKMIGATDKTIGEFEHNVVYKITDGDIENAVKFKIDRSEKFQKKLYSTSTETSQRSQKDSCNFTPTDYEDIEDAFPPRTSFGNSRVGAVNSNENIYDEKVDQNSYGSKVYFEGLRYYRNGHLINGIWCYIPQYENIIYMGQKQSDAESYFWSKVNKPFADGMFVNKETKDSYIPFIHTAGREITHPIFLYFFEGIRLKDELDYDACMYQIKNKSPWGYKSLSCCSAHPVIDINGYKHKTNQGVILNNELFTGDICPLLSEKVYKFKYGNLVSWVYRKDKEDSIVKDKKVIVQSLKDAFEDIPEEKDDKNEEDSFLEERLEKEIEEIFTAPYKKYPSILKQLDRYSHLQKGEKAISIIEDFIEGMSELITIEVKE